MLAKQKMYRLGQKKKMYQILRHRRICPKGPAYMIFFSGKFFSDPRKYVTLDFTHLSAI